MANMISKKPILIGIVLCALLSFLFVGNAYAASTSVSISNGSGPVLSSVIATNYGVSYYGSNSNRSGHILHISIEEKTGAYWRTDTSNPMGIGQTASGSSKLKVPAQWRVKLNPDNYHTDCSGYGQISGS
ncbi:Uncharacterized [Syntrophomonas zehnderi OL-4]|uniref:Uncharacterized n=1 Tax=Syntrophomonas zehnderi OL-4 TaxID=690567 RepID=A0A0E4GC65_9FIRM|nr:hypothetical protein [Syntrophomonas zehnderi]CFY10881.1 Uncharacterized [Syntrophomonas zehnderi OL-4]